MFNRTSVFHKLSYIVLNNPSPNPSLFLAIRSLSKACSDPSQSFPVSYLKQKLGFSSESALAAKATYNLCFKTPEKPDDVIAFLEKHGFSETQIKRMITYRPVILSCDTEKTLLPKIEFLRSMGISNPELTKIVTWNPALLTRSLEKTVIPCFNLVSKLLKSDSRAIKAIKQFPHLLTYDLETYMLPNINVLLDNGVPESNIILMFQNKPRCFVLKAVLFKKIVEEVKEIGFDPSMVKFLYAVVVFKKASKSLREKKFDAYKRWGWSEQEIWDAFRTNPCVLETSSEKISAVMEFLVNKMGFQSSAIAKTPSVFRWSFEKRILPRGLFAQELLSKGLIDKFKLSALFESSEKKFIERFVNRYESKSPELLMLYEEKLELAVVRKYRSGS